MKKYFDFSNIPLFNGEKIICLNLNFVKDNYITFNELKI